MQWVHKDPCLFSLSTFGLTKRSLSLSNGSINTIRITLRPCLHGVGDPDLVG